MQQFTQRCPSTTNSRQREFSRIRNDYSQHSVNSHSRSNDQSIKASIPPKVDHNKSKQVDSQKPNLQKHQTPVIISNHNKSCGYTQSKQECQQKMLCIGCYNHKLSQVKQRKKKIQQVQQSRKQHKLSLIQDYHTKQHIIRSIYEQEYQNMKNYNKKQIIQHIKKKQQQKQQREKMIRLSQQQQIQNRKRLEQKTRINQQKRYKLKQDLQNQINKKKQRLALEQIQQKKQIQILFQEHYRQNIHQSCQQIYRKQLNQQIQDDRNKVDKQIKQSKKYMLQNKFNFNYQSYQRQLIMEKQNKKRKYQIIQQAKKRKIEKQQQKKQQQLKKHSQQRQRRASELHEQQLQKQKDQFTQNQINLYISQLKKQVNEQQQRRKQQKNKKYNIGQNILNNKQNINFDKECDGCQKKYPTKYLTRVSQTLQI